MWACEDFTHGGSATLPSHNNQGVPLLALWHNWQTVQYHLTFLFQCSLFPSSHPKWKGWGAGGFHRCWFVATAHWKKDSKTCDILSSIYLGQSTNVGDRRIWGFKPLYLLLHKSCFIVYTSALANMICIVTSRPAIFDLHRRDDRTCAEAFCSCAGRPLEGKGSG